MDWSTVSLTALMMWASMSLMVTGCRCLGSEQGQPHRERGQLPSSRGSTPESSAAPATPNPRDPGGSPAASVPSAPPELAPLRTDSLLVDLDVTGFRPAVVYVPQGIQEPRPVVLATHGNYDRPEWQCDVWRRIATDRFVLCPRGVPRHDAPKSHDRWTYGGKFSEEMVAAVTALEQRFEGYVDSEEMTFIGFSLGAILGVNLISKKILIQDERALRFSSAVLIEGGYKGWNAATARGYEEQGGERILFACGQSACRHASKAATRALERAGVATVVVGNGNVGHTYDGLVAEAVGEHWDFVVQGRPSAETGPSPSNAQPESPQR